MQKVDLSTWGGSKVRANLKRVWPLASLPASADTDMGTYQTSLSANIQNTNELIDWKGYIEGVLARRPF
jgi:hypothetical protein